ncbi:trans-sulfuration enzyme family protein [Ornithinimicrobium cryptoxanthini]|uniref:PLP-dependent aspartate aminotransferase family protein n=1 Tax=Ornithinimicrobium cryptoxanthini TaxID=2934161 RepID=A0ABY4YIT5_9MICO|nr:PLP-dependent aspartate aminotransferase family protein [Ornithinimicrobium cryptoxanthini]USQ76706.1 PLP-dependent aspartate aminotransferase family protein [Ornithinimicrobium cryptoxanthini]
MSFDTDAVHAAREDLTALGAHVPPIDLSTTYPVGNVETGGASYENLATGGTPAAGDSLVYQRLWNPTVGRLEEALARLEGAEQAVAFGSGMAALSATLLAAVAAGKPHVVAVRPLYGGTDHILATGLLGTRVTWVEADGVAAAIEPDTGLVVVETPANPTLDLVDLTALVRQAGDVPVVVDNTFATPVLQRPLELGVTIVLHSATKFLGGHGDIMAGLVATNAEWAGRIRSIRALTGGLLHPMAAYQVHRGLQTLPVRVRAQQDNAQVVAHWLTKQDAVSQVFHPSIEGCDPQGLVGTQMSGAGSVLAFAVESYAVAAAVAQSCRLITHAVSLGGVDSLIQHPASLTHRPVAPEARPAASVLRLSVGLEDPADIVADLRQAFAAATAQDGPAGQGSQAGQDSHGASSRHLRELVDHS